MRAQPAGSCGQVYVARPGDTIWAIAVAYSRGGDPRPLVANLESEIGGGALQPGERLIVPCDRRAEPMSRMRRQQVLAHGL